jgi:hypothetical protein
VKSIFNLVQCHLSIPALISWAKGIIHVCIFKCFPQ